MDARASPERMLGSLLEYQDMPSLRDVAHDGCLCTFTVRGASKIKLKNVNKKRMATARRLIFLEFLKASIADLITLFFSSLQNFEGCGDSDSGDSFADPCQFLPFPKTKI
jgi:hypothetical protein